MVARPKKMTQSPVSTVSVCIPAYRGSQLLGRTIETVLTQTFSNFELLIIDDNSPDDTAAVVARYHDPRIRFLRNPHNLGPEGNWNRCLSESRGKYFKLLPQDDLLLPACLERQLAVLEKDTVEDIALVFCARRIVDSSDQAVTVRGYPGGKQGVIPGRAVVKRCVRFGTNLIGEPGSVMFRKSLALQVGPFDATNAYVIDLDYWFRLLLKGDAYYLPEPLAAFRVSRGSWSVAIGTRQSVDFCQFVSRISLNPVHAVSRFDIAAGRLMAKINNYLRLLFYRFVLR
jgi:glycosyltransferase involved in cell wall biosynthesis